MIHSLADLYNKIINTRDHESLRSRPLVFLALATESLPAEGQDTFWGALQGFLRGLTHAHHLGPSASATCTLFHVVLLYQPFVRARHFLQKTKPMNTPGRQRHAQVSKQ